MIPVANPDVFASTSTLQNPSWIDPRAIVEGAEIGAGTRVWPFAHVAAGAVVGTGCRICGHTYLASSVTVGDNVVIEHGVYLRGGTVVESDAYLGANVAVAAGPEGFGGAAPVMIRRGARIGAGVVLLPGVEVGPFAVVAPGSVVARSVPAEASVSGNPARQTGNDGFEARRPAA